MQNNRDKERSNDRIIYLRKIEGQKIKDSLGNVDPSLFQGGNRVHAIMDPQTCLWEIKYDKGIVPPIMKQRFTSYPKLMAFLELYFRKRGLEVEKVED